MLLDDGSDIDIDVVAAAEAAAKLTSFSSPPGDDVLPGVSAAAFPWVALAIALPTALVLRAVASDARAASWDVMPKRYLIRWSAPSARRYELPTGGSELMRAGPDNGLALSSKAECVALGRQFEKKFTGITYQIYEVKGGEGEEGGAPSALRIVGSYPKPVNAAGTSVRASADAQRSARDPLAEDSLGDSWRELFESYASEIDDEWARFRESLFVVGGSRLQVVRPGEEDDGAPGEGRGSDDSDSGADDGDDDDGEEGGGKPTVGTPGSA